ncbi:MAG: hypothetical protein QOH51_3128 [Acidobacteriota bacterium]|jgi:hypothetical protein|nr:hypothetical protein [Acidobacteriota bacterium]
MSYKLIGANQKRMSLIHLCKKSVKKIVYV